MLELRTYQRTLFAPDAEPVEVSPELCSEYDEDRYSPR